MRPFICEFISRNLHNVVVHSTVPVAVSVPLIGTHDGSFHCDEAMACGLLKHTKAYASAQIVRTRDEASLAQCNVVVDVGGKYDPKSLRLDHHQKEFQETLRTTVQEYHTRMSSAGLVYKHFGREIIVQYAEYALNAGQLSALPTEKDLDVVYDRMYKNFVEQVDGIDNGVDEYSIVGDNTGGVKQQKNYRTTTSLSARVGSLVPRWNDVQTKEAYNASFSRAMQLTAGEFFDHLDFYLQSWMPARAIITDSFAKADSVHPSKQIFVLEKGGVPWREHLLDIEKEYNCIGRTLYVVFADSNRGYRVQAVPKDIGGSSFGDRKSLPWKGLRDDALSQASGIPGGIFVHVSGFIGGNQTYEGALAMAVKALEM